MKHSIKITAILLVMFFVTQLIGLAVIGTYGQSGTCKFFNQTTSQYDNKTEQINLPQGIQAPEPKTSIEFWSILPSIIIAFVIAVSIIFLLSRVKIAFIMRYWFFAVIILALWITINSMLRFILLKNNICNPTFGLFSFQIPYVSLIAIVLAVTLAIYKIFKRDILLHNITELLIYPGIAAVLVPILNIWTIIVLLFIISAYDIYAVWHSGFMQKMAKFQINTLKLFTGFFVPYMHRKDKDKVMAMSSSQRKKAKVKVSLAILGGGDVVFPIITAGVVLRTFGLFPALLVTIFATIALFLLFMFARKGKFYPAMPFLTAGILVGIALGFIL